MDDKTRIELEAAVYRRLVEHLRGPKLIVFNWSVSMQPVARVRGLR